MGWGAKGLAGEIRLAGRVAAQLGPWNMEQLPEEGGWRIRADVVPNTEDFYLLEEEDSVYEVRLRMGRHLWRWKHVEVSVNGNATIRGDGQPDVLDSDE